MAPRTSLLRTLLPMGALAVVVVGFAGAWRQGGVLNDGAGMQAILRLALSESRNGGFPYWVDQIWGGTPAWALGPSFAVTWMLPLAHWLGPDEAIKYGGLAAQVVGAWGAFVMARSLWGGTAAPTLAGFLFGLSPLAIGHTTLYGHESVAWVIAAVPWFAWTYRHAISRGGLRWMVAAGAIAAFALLQQAEHAYSFALLALAYMVVEMTRRRGRGERAFWPVVGRTCGALVVCAGLAAHWLMPLAALHDSFVLDPPDTVQYELREGITASFSNSPQTFVSPSQAHEGLTDGFYLGAAALAASALGVALLRRDEEGWLTATVLVSGVCLWLSTGAIPLARSTLGGSGLAAFAGIGLFAGALAGSIIRHVRPGRRRAAAFALTLLVLPAIPFVTPFLALQSVVPMLDSVRFPRFYPFAVIGVSLAAAYPVAVLSPRVGAGLPRGRALFSAALAMAVAGVVLVDIQPYRRFYELRPPGRDQSGLDSLTDWAQGLPAGERIGTQMYDRPAVIEALMKSGRELSVGWPHPLAGSGIWHLTGEASSAGREYARRAMGVASTTLLVSDPLLHAEVGEELVGGYRITRNEHALPPARLYRRALVVADRQLAGRLAVSLAAKGVAVITAERPPALPGVTVEQLPDQPCPGVESAAGRLSLPGVDLGAEVARACALGRWLGLPTDAVEGAERDRTTSVVVAAHQDGLAGVSLFLDRPPGVATVTLRALDGGAAGPPLATATSAGMDADGMWAFDFPPVAGSAGRTFLATLACPDCGRGGGPRLRTVPDFRGEPDVFVDDEAVTGRLGTFVPLYGSRPGTARPTPVPAARTGAGRWKVEAGGGGLLVVATAHFPGWEATVGGTGAPVVAADGGLVGVPVPEGGADVALQWHRPAASSAGRAVTGVTGLAALACLLLRRRRRRAVEARPAPAVVGGRLPTASVVVPTCNDAPNIAALLRSLLAEPDVAEVVVVASGCEDDTVGQVLELAAGSSAAGRLRLIVEDRRSGKAGAINLGVAEARCRRILVASGDVLFDSGAVRHLLRALEQPGVGMAGGRPVPVNDPDSLVGHAVVLHWRLHHRMALRRPKLGEMIALRRELADPLPRISMDEAFLQARVEAAGWSCAYVPEAVVHNRGPETVADFILQRRRNHAGHLWLEHGQGYRVPSLSPMALVSDLLAELRDDRSQRRPKRLAWTAATMVLEVWARLLAHADIATGREQHVWTLVETAKNPAGGEDGGGPGGGTELSPVGVPTPAPRQRHGEHQLPLQLQVRDVQRVRAQGDGADDGRVVPGLPVDGPGSGLDDLQRR